MTIASKIVRYGRVSNRHASRDDRHAQLLSHPDATLLQFIIIQPDHSIVGEGHSIIAQQIHFERHPIAVNWDRGLRMVLEILADRGNGVAL
jgi:hypothetical protein